MDRTAIILAILLGLAANIAYGLLLKLVVAPEGIQWVITFVLLMLTAFLGIHYRRVASFGVAAVRNASGGAFSLEAQIAKSRSSLSFLGVSARTIIDPEIEAVIRRKLLTNAEYTIRFLLFDSREYEKLERRAYEETGDKATAVEWRASMQGIIRMLMRIKKALGESGLRLQVKTYRWFPVFRMIIVDDSYILLNHYEKGRYPSAMPHAELTVSKNVETLGQAFKKFFEESWAEANEVVAQAEQ
jgi:hypothetical protein